MIRIFGLLVLASTIFQDSSVFAQDASNVPVQTANVQQSDFQRAASTIPPHVQSTPQHQGFSRPFRLFRRGNQYRPRYTSRADRINHAKYELYTQRYPKFYGGFHSSHFSNIGVATGDLGFRGNGVYWAPW